jgi:hypothetical protein
MLPFDSSRAQAHSKFASKFDMHGNEELSEGEKMEVNSRIAPKSQPTELKAIFGTKIFFSVANGFGETEGVALVPTFALVKL